MLLTVKDFALNKKHGTVTRVWQHVGVTVGGGGGGLMKELNGYL